MSTDTKSAPPPTPFVFNEDLYASLKRGEQVSNGNKAFRANRCKQLEDQIAHLRPQTQVCTHDRIYSHSCARCKARDQINDLTYELNNMSSNYNAYAECESSTKLAAYEKSIEIHSTSKMIGLLEELLKAQKEATLALKHIMHNQDKKALSDTIDGMLAVMPAKKAADDAETARLGLSA